MTTDVMAPPAPEPGPDAGEVTVEKAKRDLSWIGLIITPLMAVILGGAMLIVLNTASLDQTTRNILESSKLWTQFKAHLFMTFWSTLFVIAIAVPLGIFLTRPRFRKFAPTVVGFANSGQALPAYGLLIIFFMWLGAGIWTAIFAFTLYAIIPVLRNTMVGLDSVDRAVLESGRGMGMSRMQVLRRIELPLAVPVIMAGVRTALVINVGMAALGVFIGAGGLGETINSGLKLRRDIATFMGAGIVATLALSIDWLAALAERYLRPRGL